jgi:DNA repair protein RecO (recombination protein O)
MPRPEKVFRTEAIILRRYEFGEADRLLTLLTPDHGKLRAIARGVRKPTARMTGHVELFSRAWVLLARGQELYTVSQAEQLEPYLPLREDLERGAHAHYVVELLDRFSEDEEALPPLYALLDATLGWMCASDADLGLVTRFFELQLLRLVGFQPSLFRCAVGQEEVKPQDQFFSAPDGGVICPAHAPGHAAIPLSLAALKTMRFLQTRQYGEVRQRVRMTDAIRSEVERALRGYIVHLLESQLKTVDFIHRLQHRDS